MILYLYLILNAFIFPYTLYSPVLCIFYKSNVLIFFFSLPSLFTTDVVRNRDRETNHDTSNDSTKTEQEDEYPRSRYILYCTVLYCTVLYCTVLTSSSHRVVMMMMLNCYTSIHIHDMMLTKNKISTALFTDTHTNNFITR